MQDGELTVTPEEHEAAASDLGPLGTGFWEVWDTSVSAAVHELCGVIREACDFTVVVENYIQGRWMQRTSTEMIDQRNHAQHTLMSLKTSQEWENKGVEVDLQYESCRLAVIIYSFHTT